MRELSEVPDGLQDDRRGGERKCEIEGKNAADSRTEGNAREFLEGAEVHVTRAVDAIEFLVEDAVRGEQRITVPELFCGAEIGQLQLVA